MNANCTIPQDRVLGYPVAGSLLVGEEVMGVQMLAAVLHAKHIERGRTTPPSPTEGSVIPALQLLLSRAD